MRTFVPVPAKQHGPFRSGRSLDARCAGEQPVAGQVSRRRDVALANGRAVPETSCDRGAWCQDGRDLGGCRAVVTPAANGRQPTTPLKIPPPAPLLWGSLPCQSRGATTCSIPLDS
ncbi:hypothetical protein M8818_002832 [Zalaria obscura]|uniref:Uncharacterized protein n=1 Tax=Zalaria obscura TaxID=2024903 RepID=A0ACC3SHJ6_9PEZI